MLYEILNRNKTKIIHDNNQIIKLFSTETKLKSNMHVVLSEPF